MERKIFPWNGNRKFNVQASVLPGRWVHDVHRQQLCPTSSVRPHLTRLPSAARINYVPQSYYGITRAGVSAQYLVTSGLLVCVSVMLYHKASQTAALAHMDDNDPLASLHVIAEHLSRLQAPPDQCVARIIGGQSDFSEFYVENIQRALQDLKIQILERDALGTRSREILFDSQTGIVYDNRMEQDAYRDLQQRIGIRQLEHIGNKIILYNGSAEGL